MNEKSENPKESKGFSATAKEASRGESGGNGPAVAESIKKEGRRKADGSRKANNKNAKERRRR